MALSVPWLPGAATDSWHVCVCVHMRTHTHCVQLCARTQRTCTHARTRCKRVGHPCGSPSLTPPPRRLTQEELDQARETLADRKTKRPRAAKLTLQLVPMDDATTRTVRATRTQTRVSHSRSLWFSTAPPPCVVVPAVLLRCGLPDRFASLDRAVYTRLLGGGLRPAQRASAVRHQAIQADPGRGA